MHKEHAQNQGFTLIELSIVLVIIGLIVGGVVVAQDLIAAATTRAQITQIEKYNASANTFYVKYGYLPGDIPNPYAGQFGFQARGVYAGEGDGNGILEGVNANAGSSNSGYLQGGGETAMFWVDLSTANMMDGSFNTATTNNPVYAVYTGFGTYFPSAKIGNGNYIYIWSGGAQERFGPGNGKNYFGIAAITTFGAATTDSNAAMTVAQAYNIDKKIDDGFPQTGNVTAEYDGAGYMMWAPYAAGITDYGYVTNYDGLAGSSVTCFDNGGVSGVVPMVYSMEISKGSNPNCALSFKMQGAAR